MAQRIVIEPVTRIEGHAKITIQLDGEGNVADAWFHVTQLRGFEKNLSRQTFQRDAVFNGSHLRDLPCKPLDRFSESL